MYSIMENKKYEFTIKKSKFISYIFRIDKKEEIASHIKQLKNQYKDASHCCYAYIFHNDMKASDDNEPNKTAGAPILDVLKKHELNYVLCVVIRYFGGIKLGPGGLIRAYSSSCKEVIKNNIVELEEGYLVEVNTTYDKQKILEHRIPQKNIVQKDYKENIKLIIKANKELLNKLDENHIPYHIKENINIEKSS